MATNPKENYEKIQKVLTAWRNLRPAKSFSGLTVDEFAKRVAPSDITRETIARLENELTAAQNQRDEADATGVTIAQAVINAVKGDLQEGEDGELYEAMGYVRKSERKSGLHRSAKANGTATK
jgi:uncharacterized small protein (DUF1192 family)